MTPVLCSLFQGTLACVAQDTTNQVVFASCAALLSLGASAASMPPPAPSAIQVRCLSMMEVVPAVSVLLVTIFPQEYACLVLRGALLVIPPELPARLVIHLKV